MINWQPFSTAPKDRPFYAYSRRDGIEKLEWKTPPPGDGWEPRFRRISNDPDSKSIISHSGIYPDNWDVWCEVSDMVPISSRNHIDHFQDDIRRG